MLECSWKGVELQWREDLQKARMVGQQDPRPCSQQTETEEENEKNVTRESWKTLPTRKITQGQTTKETTHLKRTVKAI